jgi:hypothetical protein
MPTGRRDARSGAIDEPSTKNAVLWLTVALGCYLIVYYFVGERVPYDGGLGFDGHFYGTLARDVPGVLVQRIPEYYLDRILPSVIVWLSAKTLGLSLIGTDQVVSAFHIYDSVLLVAASFAWVRLSRTLKLSAEVATLGWACLFLNWSVLKQYLYFPVQTDTTALALGVCAALCAIERRYFLLAIVAVVASFAFKIVMPMVALLIVFSAPANKGAPSRFEVWLGVAAAALVCTIVLDITLWERFSLRAGAAQVNLTALPLSILILAIYVYHVGRNTPIFRILAACRIGRLGEIGFYFGLWGFRAAVLTVMFRLYANDTSVLDGGTFVMGSFALSVAKPGIFLVAYVVTFGPAFILVLGHLRRVMEAAAAHSAGAALFVIVTLAMAIGETRTMTFAYPLLVTFLCVALQDIQVRLGFALAFVAISLLLSRFYLPLNALGMGTLGPGPLTDIGALLEFPWQWFFMNNGPYMAWTGYAVNLALVTVTGAILIVLHRRPAAHSL